MTPTPAEVSKGPQAHQVLGTACGICTAGSRLALPYTRAGTSQAAGTAPWPPSSAHTPMATGLAPQFTEPEVVDTLQQPSSLCSRLGCNSKRGRALKVSWQETRCIACCYSSPHPPLPSLLPELVLSHPLGRKGRVKLF